MDSQRSAPARRSNSLTFTFWLFKPVVGKNPSLQISPRKPASSPGCPGLCCLVIKLDRDVADAPGGLVLSVCNVRAALRDLSRGCAAQSPCPRVDDGQLRHKLRLYSCTGRLSLLQPLLNAARVGTWPQAGASWRPTQPRPRIRTEPQGSGVVLYLLLLFWSFKSSPPLVRHK